MNPISISQIRQYLLGFIVVISCFFGTCSNQLAGGTSTTDNPKIFGVIIGDDQQPAQNTQVVLLPQNYNPLIDSATLIANTTDANGRYVLPVFHNGVYNIQAVNLVKSTRLLIQKIAVTEADDSVQVNVDTLKHSGTIKVELPDSIDRTNGYIYIPGTTIFTLLADTGSQVMLNSVPAATLPTVCYSTRNTTDPTVLRHSVIVSPDSTTVVAMTEWKYSARLFFNTTSSGAGVTGTVRDFPVLVRLNSRNFEFSQALSNGEDIRFTKADGSPMSFEFGQWDAASQLAAIWVKVDTVYGNDDSHFIFMYWGNSNAQSVKPNGAAVFDSANGFEGVWHLNETSGTQAADASQNGFAGTYMGGLPRNVNGPTGICQSITQPFSDYVDMGNVLNPEMKNISIGIWAKKDSSGTLTLIAKTNGYAPSAEYGYALAITDKNFPLFYMASGGAQWGDDSAFDISSSQAITDTTTWHYLFVVVDRTDNDRCKMYVDGIDKTGIVQGDVTKVANVNNDHNLRIGIENDNDCPFKGMIGEATIAFTTRSADWVKLSYMNQKEQDALVKW